MTALETVFVAFSMFSALPTPQLTWSEKNMRYALCAFPLVGAVCGGLWWAWSALCAWLAVPTLLQGAGLSLLPVLVTGGIHLDGYADTCDALASCADPARKQEILKDPRCGAFAVIRLCTYFAAHFALCAVLEPTARALGCMTLAFLLERALSGLAISRFPLAKNTGLAHTFATAADKTRVGRVLILLCALLGAGMIWVGGVAGTVMLAAGLLVFRRYRAVADRQFGGISGDLAGWFLQKAELWMLAALVACQVIGKGEIPWF
jgi:adenosylcobinamide-GDP ribazoletransferase